MAEKYGFFNSVNGDRIYDAADVANYISRYFTNGIFNNSMQVTANDNMTVTVATGSANINGYAYDLQDALTLDIGDPDQTLSRIDSVVLRLDLTNRQISTQIIEGTYATTPSQPAITRSNTIYDLRLANISVPVGATRITADMISDTRFGEECGNVVQAVQTLDTSDIFAQYQAAWNTWFSGIQSELSGDVAGNLQNGITNLRIALGINQTTYDEEETYSKGDLVVYNYMIYECNTDNTTGTWDSTKWDIVPIIKN